MYETAATHYRFLSALLIAAFCHLIIGLVVLSQWPQPHAPETTTLQVTISAPAPAPTAVQESSQPETKAPVVTSQSAESPLVFQHPGQLPGRVPALRSPSADTGWVGTLFTSPAQTPDQTGTTTPEITRLSTQDLPLLSPYQRRLLEVMSQRQYHDAQYAFSQLTQERQVRLKLKLLANGTLVRADILVSSGDPALDQAAQRSAYAASPFPPPPAEDAASGYNYTIDIRYRPAR